MPIFTFIGHILTALFGKTDNWRQMHKQTNSTFYSSNEVCLKNNVVRRKKFRGCFYVRKHPGHSLVNRLPRLAGMISIFICMRSFVQVWGDENVRWYIVLSLVQFDFSYISVIITFNSAFIFGLSTSRSNPAKVICDLYAEM